MGKTDIDILNLIKIKIFCLVKSHIKRIKRPPTVWEKIFENHIPDKGLVPRIYK